MNDIRRSNVYIKSKELTLEIFDTLSNNNTSKYGFIINQLLRAVSSIGANIVEGYGRYYKRNYKQFLAIARGSCFETQYWIELAKDTKLLTEAEADKYYKVTVEIVKMLTVMMKRLDDKI